MSDDVEKRDMTQQAAQHDASQQPSAQHDAALLRDARQKEFTTCIAQFINFEQTIRKLSEHTIKAYASDLDAFMGWISREGIDPYNISHRQLRLYLLELTRAAYSERTINRHLSAMRSLYKWLQREGLCVHDPANAMTSPKIPKTLPKVMDLSSVGKLLDSCVGTDAINLRDKAFLELLYASGARISEIANLIPADIDFSQRQVSLFGKGSKQRIVPLYQKALDAVKIYLHDARGDLLAKTLTKRLAKQGSSRRQAQPSKLFISSRGNNMSAAALRKVFEQRVMQAGLDPSLTPHAMRHTFATLMLDGRADLRSVQELLGHESLSTTQIYTHLSIDRLKQATLQAHPRSQTKPR